MTLLAVDLTGPRGPEADPAAVPRYAVSRPGWYSHYGDFEENPNESYNQNDLRASALLVYSTTTFDRLAINLSTGSGGGGSNHKFRIGLYSDNGQGYPASLLRSGQTDNSTTGQNPPGEVPISPITLARGIWWLAFHYTAKPDVNFPYVRSLNIGLGWPTLPNGAYGYAGSISGDLPATFPAGVGTVGGGQRHPRVLIRAA